MIKQLLDPANMITASGLCLATVGIALTVAGFPEVGLAAALWALLADHLDGVIAKRTRGRAPETGEIGKNLDSLADLVSAGIFPALALMVVAKMSAIAVACGALLVIASALRLSYFNVFGSPGGRFIGVPTTYAVPVTAVLFLVRPELPPSLFPILFGGAIVILAILHVAPLRIPKTSGRMYFVVTAFCVLASLVLVARDTGL
ncbi:CDP-diacylglycerol--serine O-phosphatidyltransferase [Rhizobium sp. ERR 1071]|uniref:CDP-alcohol phosphatidyltransferase family protein n=1 Tax=Rhizobium sp. ERR 1071 TaxID=2572677 RepID=UPI00119B7AC8|nr:CDP-alcohol phosphatidyltransferase family protein [Rhizobium sp. ERR1071]TWB08256.1 CDP-diacylglycerol--serine O-phosphatidyltransferase [Rhizobium sp. ERR1071]